MVTTPEGWIKKIVKDMFDRTGWYYHMPVQNGMGAPTLDFICCVNGRYIAIETKAPGEDLTHRQELTAKDIRRANGAALVISSWHHVIDLWAILMPSSEMPQDAINRYGRWWANASRKSKA